MEKRISTHKLKAAGKRLMTAALVTALGFSLVNVSDMYYGYSPNVAYAAELTGQAGTVSVPAWNSANIPAKDTSGTKKYYYAGNAFHALNQLNDGVIQTGKGTSGHLQVYSDSNGARLVETTVGSNMAVKGNLSGGSDFQPFTQRSDIDFSKTWELMDTDAVWDDQYLFAQYQTGAFAAVTSAFTPTILTTVNDWYSNGFSYNGTPAGRPNIAAPNKSWFSDAEKSAVKSASVKTDGATDSANTNTAGDHIDNASLFPASIDEMYYNPVQVEEIIANLAADKSDVYNATSWQCARSYLWSRSFWGVYSDGLRCGFVVDSPGQVGHGHVASGVAVAPAFYLDLSKVAMARSAKAGNEVTANAALAAYNPSAISGDVKFLVKDSAFAPSFTSSIHNKQSGNIVAGNTYTVDYSGAVTTPVNDAGKDGNSKLVISAAVYDNTGKILYYSPVADVTGTSGTVNVQIPSGLTKGSTYTLEIFEEQLGGTSTYKTKENSKNGNTFTQTNGGTYTSYETDYKSGKSALMNITISASDFDVTVKDGAYMYSGRTYTASEIGQLVNAKIGGTTLPVGEYYVISKADFESLGSTAYSVVSSSSKTNKVPIEQLSGDSNSTVDLVFIYYASRPDGTAQVVERTLTVVPDQIENNVDFDSKTWYTATENDIEWYYKLNANGDIIGLYTESSIVPLVDSGNTLNVPTKVAGRTVIGIGSGSEEHPFIPSAERSWTSISFPSSVAIIQDYAFLDSDASANIVIPSTITNIGVKAFYKASLISLKINNINGTIGSLAFGETANLDSVTIKGGSKGLTVSTIAFRESHATSVTIVGNVTVNKNAFKNNLSLRKIYITGNVDLKEYAFSGCTAADTLEMSGRVNVGQYAFTNLTSLGRLYLPSGVTLNEYSFNDCTALQLLETDTNLVNNSFAGCDQIQKIILDENVTKVEYDWEGHCGSYGNRKIYVRNKNTIFDMYGNGGYISPFGSTGDIIVYIINDKTVDQGKDVAANDDILSLLGYTCYAHSLDYQSYIYGLARSVTFYTTNNIDNQLKTDGIQLNEEKESVQTGIDAYYSGTILTTRDIAKENMTVIPIYGSNEGTTPYSTDEFFVIRTDEFNSLEAANNLTIEAVSALEPVHAESDDLDIGSTTGTIPVTVIVFYEEDGAKDYFSTPVSVRVEKYTAESYVEQVYGSYENIVKNLAELSTKVAALEQQVKDLEGDKEADAATIDALTKELAAYKKAYNDLLAKFAEFVDSSKTDDSGYFGTFTDPVTGEEKEVVYINGEPTTFEDSGETTTNGDKIYTGQYDTNGDGTPETIKFYVDENGVHLVDDTGNDTGVVYEDTLGAIQRQMAAKLKEVESALTVSQNGLNSIISALKDAGYEFAFDITIDDSYKEIVKDIKDMANKITSLEGDLNTANQNVSKYEQAIANIYALLTNSTLEKDNIQGITNAINAVVEKISTLKNNLDVATATVKDLQTKLSEKEDELSALDTELQTTKDQLKQANDEIKAAEQAKSDLTAQYEQALRDGDTAAAERLQAEIDKTQDAIDQLKAVQGTLAQKEQDIKDAQDTILLLRNQIAEKNQEIASLQAQLDALTDTADGFKITVDTANKMFGLELPDGSTDKEIADAIDKYVKEKISSDETIAAIQKLVGSTNTGLDLVADVKTAVDNGTGSTEGYIDDSVVDKNSNNYKSGYEAGYAAGAVNSGNLDDSEIHEESNNYKAGYNAGVLAGSIGKTDDTKVNTQSQSYKQGYTIGYNEGYLKATDDLGSGSDVDLPANMTDMKKQIELLTSQVTTLSNKNSELSTQVTTLTADNTTLKKKVGDLEDDVDDLEDDNKDLKKSNKDLESKNSNLSSQVSSVNGELSSLRNNNSNLQSQVSDLNSKNTALSNQVSDLSTKNSALNTEVSNLKSQKTTTTTTSTSNTAATTKAQEEAKKAQEDLKKSQEENKKLQEEIDKMKTDKENGELEGSTQNLNVPQEQKAPDMLVSGTLVAAENSQQKLGKTSEVSMFSDSQINTIAPGQFAKGSVIRFTDSNPIVKISSSNGKGVNDISQDSLNNIYKILNYYTNHMEELGKLGSDDIINAAADDSKAVVLDMVAAGDILASSAQEAAFKNNTSAKLELSFPNITNGALYLIVHERADRPGQYEVCLTTAASNNVSMNVSSLSPVAVASVQIKDASAVVNSTLIGEDVEAMNTPAPEKNGRSGFGVVLIILLIIALLIGAGVFVIMKLKKEGRLPEFLGFLYD